LNIPAPPDDRVRTYIDFRTKTAVLEFLRTVCRLEDGFAVYDGKWDDVAVARHLSGVMGRTITRGNVLGTRRENIGIMRPPATKAATPGVQTDAMTDHINRLIGRLDQHRNELVRHGDTISQLVARVTELEVKVERLQRPPNLATMTAIDKALAAATAVTPGRGNGEAR